MNLLTWAIIIISLPLNLWAIYTVGSQVNDHVAPFYVNLFLADLIQLCSMIVLEILTEWKILYIVSFIFDFGVAVRVGFMLCAALERYLIITRPLWYKSKGTVKKTVVICVLVWTLPVAPLLFFYFQVYFEFLFKIYSAFLLLPLPLLMFFLDGTLKALSTSSSALSDEKRRIVHLLVPELLIYSLLFLPRVIWFLTHGDSYGNTFNNLSLMFCQLSPLADVVLYVFMRKGTIASMCCCCSSNGKNDDIILTVSCTEMEGKQKGKCGQICFEQQGHCGLEKPQL